MDICLTAMIIGLILFFTFVIFLVYIDIKKYEIHTYQNTSVNSVKANLLQELRLHGYKFEDSKKQTVVEKNTLTAASIIFKQEQNNVKIYRKNATTNTGLAIVIILAFLILIGGLILALYIDYSSSRFAKEELLPIINGSSKKSRFCSNCGRVIPRDALICPYCGVSF